MQHKIADSLMESLYTAAVLFVYYYIFTAVINFKSWTLGFHPDTDVAHLAIVYVLMLLTVMSVRCLIAGAGFFADDARASQASPYQYTPAHRKGI